MRVFMCVRTCVRARVCVFPKVSLLLRQTQCSIILATVFCASHVNLSACSMQLAVNVFGV